MRGWKEKWKLLGSLWHQVRVCVLAQRLCVYQSHCHALTLEPFYASIWFGQGVKFYVLFSMILCFYVLAGYGSQSGTAVYRCL